MVSIALTRSNKVFDIIDIQMNSLRYLLRGLKPSLHRYLQNRQFSVYGGFLASKVKQIEVDNFINIRWDNGENSRFPFVFLREKCPCHSCFHDSSQQRILHMKNLDLKSKPVLTTLKDDGEKVQILWDDNHFSEYDSKFLYNKIIPDAKLTKSIIREDARIWDKDLEIQTFDFESMLRDEQKLLGWLMTMRHDGVAKITGVPRKLGQVERFGNAVGYLKNTFYGESVSLRSEANARSLAYTSKELQPHTDLPYYEFKPSVILLQCIEQVKSNGGVNTLVDGFNIIEHFKQEQPKYYELMVSTPVVWQVIGRENIYGNFKMTFPRPVIEVDWTGKVSRINYNEPLRESFLNVTVDNITDVYHAYNYLTKMFYDPRFVVTTKMIPGDMLTIDNDRLLHGRTAYDVRDDDVRWLHQAYVDWDVLRSKLCTLQEKLCQNISTNE